MSTFMKSKVVTVCLWAIVILWLAFIFALSAQTATQSKGFSDKVTENIIVIFAWISQTDIDSNTIKSLVLQYQHLVRKLAHCWIYFVLGVLIITTLIKTGGRGLRAYILAISFCIFYAVLDEFHQTFVLGRGAQISDVLIDTIGAIWGIGVYWTYNFLKTSNNRLS